MSERWDLRGTAQPWGQVTCHYGRNEPQCSTPATRHFLWIEDHTHSASCEEHAVFIREHSSVAFEEHAFVGDCGMPGAIWQHPSAGGDEGYCAFPLPDDAALLVEDFEPERVTP